MICPFCKETILDEAIKCRHCGSMLNLYTTRGVHFGSITADEIRAFVGPKAPYYTYQFSKFTVTGSEKFVPTWNWSTCCFTFTWMLYRKMYLLALVTFIIFCVPGLNFIMHIFAGIFGNYLYYRHVREQVLEIRATQSPDNVYHVLQELGGVHRWAIWIALAIGLILAVLFILFFATISASFSRFGVLSI